MSLHFTERQSRTIAAAITTLSALVILVVVGLLAWLAASFLRAFSGVFLPLTVGAVAAVVSRPYYEWLRNSARLGMTLAVVAVFLSALIPLGLFGWFFGRIVLDQLVGLIAQAPAWWDAVEAWLEDQTPRATALLDGPGRQQVGELIASQQEALLGWLQSLGNQVVAASLGFARGIGTLLSWVITPVYFAYFLTTAGIRFDTEKVLPFLKPDTRNDVKYLVLEFIEIVVVFFRGQMLIAFLQGILYAVGFTAIGLRYGFVIGLVLGLLNVIPYLGSIVGLAIAIPLALVQPDGGLTLIGLTLVVFIVVQQVEGWYLTPKIMGNRTGLHFMAIIVAIFFWGTALGGIPGMILAIPLTAFLASLWRLARQKWIAEIL
ncbi:MAG: AI-2E family transporter [Acidobacteria bacterium]|nr:AI-2E family transporter [Acidobacteriota bacterium]|tara:strand:- start:777 stop:1901 length:1125 start_codon:yes stop_codon:yes gene_type:complete